MTREDEIHWEEEIGEKDAKNVQNISVNMMDINHICEYIPRNTETRQIP